MGGVGLREARALSPGAPGLGAGLEPPWGAGWGGGARVGLTWGLGELGPAREG